jgi:hypothetical protein
MKTFITSLIATSALAGCGTWPSQQHANNPQSASGDKTAVVCHDESSTGSMLSQTVCRPLVTDFDPRNEGGVMTEMEHSSAGGASKGGR